MNEPHFVRAFPEPLRRAIEAVYQEVEARIKQAAPRCEASGKCCRFSEYGHTLFLSHFEAEILLETAPAYEQPVLASSCPFQIEGLCTARAERPLGCRVYYCDPKFQEEQYEITEWALKELKKLADAFDTGWFYAPLHVFLNQANRKSDSTAATSRMNLEVRLEQTEEKTRRTLPRYE